MQESPTSEGIGSDPSYDQMHEEKYVDFESY